MTWYGCGCRAAAVTPHDTWDDDASSKWGEIDLSDTESLATIECPEAELVSLPGME